MLLWFYWNYESYGKKIKGNCDFLFHNSDFFLRILSLHLVILTFFLRIVGEKVRIVRLKCLKIAQE